MSSLGRLSPEDALRCQFRLVEECASGRPLGLAVRLEAFYQHYARYAVMTGSGPPLPRHAWWPFVLSQGGDVAALIALERADALEDALGALM